MYGDPKKRYAAGFEVVSGEEEVSSSAFGLVSWAGSLGDDDDDDDAEDIDAPPPKWALSDTRLRAKGTMMGTGRVPGVKFTNANFQLFP